MKELFNATFGVEPQEVVAEGHSHVAVVDVGGHRAVLAAIPNDKGYEWQLHGRTIFLARNDNQDQGEAQAVLGAALRDLAFRVRTTKQIAASA